MSSFIFLLYVLLTLAILRGSEFSNEFNSSPIKSIPENSNYPSGMADSSNGDSPANGLTDIANMFNERGYYKSNNSGFNEQEIINNFSGNLIYEIPLYSFPLAGDLNFDLSLNYNGSVGHQVFIGNTALYNAGAFERFNHNSPEWIINLNGIAIQTLNYESSFFTNQADSNQIWGNNIKSLIPGYHFDGTLLPADGANPYNRFLILAGDGSVISLVNKNPNSYEGDYIYEGKELYYRAKVNFYESGSNGYRKRVVKLLKGDGTEFVFREYKRNFYDFDTLAIVNARRKPMMLLLEEIKDYFGHSIKLWHHTQSTSSTDFFGKGRPFIDSITADGYSDKIIKVKFIPTASGIGIQSETSSEGNYILNYSRTPVSFSQTGNQKAYINTITNPHNRKIEILNENYGRTIRNVQVVQINNGNLFNLIFNNLKRIIYFKNYFNGSNSYNYNIGPNSTSNLEVNSLSQINSRLRSSYVYYRGYGRDPFYTNMIGTKTDTSNSKAKSLSTYYYDYIDSNPNEDKIDSSDLYSTLISVFSLDDASVNNSANEIRSYSEYRNYPVYNRYNNYLEVPDIQGITKLILDSLYSPAGNQINIDINKYTYEKGFIQPDNTFNGSFLLLNKINIRQAIQRNWNYEYYYKDGNTNFDSLLIGIQETDPLLNKKKILYQNFYMTGLIHKEMSNSISELAGINSNDTAIFYKIHLPKEELALNQYSEIISRKENVFIENISDSRGYYGQLINEKFYNNYNSGEFILTEFEYYKNDFYGNEIYTEDFYPFKEGNLKRIIKPDGHASGYFYTPQSSSEVLQTPGMNPKLKYLIKYNNNTISESSDDIWDGRFPIKTVNYRINGTSYDTLFAEYRYYDTDGSPLKIINASRFLTQLNYENIHRISSVMLPGDFNSGNTAYSVKYNYDDVMNTISRLNYRSTVSGDYGRIKYAIDGFGNIKEKDIFVSTSDSNAYHYRHNFMNKPAANFEPSGDSSMFSYDFLGRLIKTKHSDLSFTLNDYSYQNMLDNYFGQTCAGFIEKQYFTDEEGSHFEKYFDAVGNLLREVKYAYEEPSDEQQIEMITDYKYDSLYRLTKVKTPEGKLILYAYDGYGRHSARITPDACQTNYFYDKNNNIIFIQDENQRLANINKYTFKNYDGMNRLTGTGEAILQPDSPNDESQYQPSTQDEYLIVNVYDTLTSSILNNLFNAPADYTPPVYGKGNLVSTAYRTRSTDEWNFKYYKYDERGRVIKMWNMIAGLPAKTISYTHNSQDQITNVYYNTGIDYKRYIYGYDFAGRLDTVNYYFGEEGTDVSSLYKNFTNYEYNPNSLVEYQNYGGTFLTNAYAYNNRNWVTQMYNSISQFIYENDYYKNGNVKSQYFYGSYRDNFENADDIYFTYNYDMSNRLINVSNEITQNNTYHLENTYDKDGNITTLKRYGDTNTIKDNFNYEYNSGTNKLNNVSGTKDQFAYDLNGNMIDDKLNVNYDFKYDHRNLINELYHKEGKSPTRVTLYVTRYYYDKAGNRIRKLIYTNLNESAGHVLDWSNLINPGNGWVLFQNEFYVRGINLS
ncbi:MAG: hypothetical protein HGGPFJEG_03174 [Ignavibacteria bacterium]|nr:hypothetical protein [Ignavibacteria bacterium]